MVPSGAKYSSFRSPPGFTTPISAPPVSGALSASTRESATRLPRVDSLARSSRLAGVVSVAGVNAVVISAVTLPTGWLPISAAAASAFLTMSSTAATRGYAAINSAAGSVVRLTLAALYPVTFLVAVSMVSWIWPMFSP
jgi:hypothetical protein